MEGIGMRGDSSIPEAFSPPRLSVASLVETPDPRSVWGSAGGVDDPSPCLSSKGTGATVLGFTIGWTRSKLTDWD